MPYTVPRTLHNCLSRYYVEPRSSDPVNLTLKATKINTNSSRTLINSNVLRPLFQHASWLILQRHNESIPSTSFISYVNFVIREGKPEVSECQCNTQILTGSSQGVLKPLMVLIMKVSLGYATTVWVGTGVNDAVRENRDDWGSSFSWNVGKFPPDCTESHPRMLLSSFVDHLSSYSASYPPLLVSFLVLASLLLLFLLFLPLFFLFFLLLPLFTCLIIYPILFSPSFYSCPSFFPPYQVTLFFSSFFIQHSPHSPFHTSSSFLLFC